MPMPVNNSINELIKTEIKNLPFLKVGELIEGTILKKDGSRRIIVDIDKYGLGVIYAGEIANVREIVKDLKEGDRIKAKVIDLDNEENMVELSLTEATKHKVWEELMALMEQEEVIKVRPKAFNRGGLLAEIKGLPVFLPVSQLSAENYPLVIDNDKTKTAEALQKLVDQELNVRIIDVNPKNKKIIISEKAAFQVSAKDLVKNYEVGQIIEGIVSGIADFGVFVRFVQDPALEGLIHISELSHRLVENAKELVKVDEPVRAKIIEIKDGKVFLSIKALLPNPWEKVLDYYKVGQIVKGTVYSFNPFGAIINLEHELQGQIHVTEFGGVEEMKNYLNLGQEYSFVIEDIKPEEKRILLKIKN